MSHYYDTFSRALTENPTHEVTILAEPVAVWFIVLVVWTMTLLVVSGILAISRIRRPGGASPATVWELVAVLFTALLLFNALFAWIAMVNPHG